MKQLLLAFFLLLALADLVAGPDALLTELVLQLEALKKLHEELIIGLVLQDAIEFGIQLIVLGEDNAYVGLLVFLLEVHEPVELVCDFLVAEDDAFRADVTNQKLLER